MKTDRIDRLALSATLHCLTGCGIGEVLGLAIGTALGWGRFGTVALAVGLAFAFGYAFTLIPLLRGGLAVGRALRLALAAYPVNRWLIARGRGHAVVQAHHSHGHHQ